MPDSLISLTSQPSSPTLPVQPCIEPVIQAHQELMILEAQMNARTDEDEQIEEAYHAADERFADAEVTTPLGILLKLKRIDEIEDLQGHLDEMPNLLWPRILIALMRDVAALARADAKVQ